MSEGEPPRGQPPIMPVGPPPQPEFPQRPGSDPTAHRRRRWVWFTIVGILFGFPTVVAAAYGSPMAFVFGFVLLVALGVGALMFAPPPRR